jgi:hypothetical protein
MNRALRNTGSPIHVALHILVKAMPMNTSCLVSQIVVDINNQLISNIHIDLRAGPLVVDTDYRALITIRGCVYPSDVPVVVDLLGSGISKQQGH